MNRYKYLAFKSVVLALILGLTGCGSNLISTEPLNDGISESDYDTGGLSSGSEGASEGLQGGVGVDLGGVSGADAPVDNAQTLGDASRPQDNLIFFEFNSAELSESSKALLQDHAAYMRSRPSVQVILEGHTDERGTVEYNLALGENRAQAVERYFSVLGVPKAQMDVVSFGEERPRAFGSSENSWRNNRRVEIVY